MNRLKNNIILVVLLAWVSLACEEELVDKAILTPEVGVNKLNDLPSSAYTLEEEAGAEVFETFTWSATDFGFDAAVSYTLQMDLADNQFSAPVNLATTYDLTATVTVAQLNKALLDKEVEAEQAVDVDFRVVSTVHSEIESVISSAMTVAITPFKPSVITPLYIIGGDQGWSLANALELHVLELGEYEVVGTFGSGNIWRFFESPAWDAVQYGGTDFTLDPMLTAMGDGDNNIRFDGTTGIYKMTVSLNTATITMEAAEEPTLYIVGDQNGWSFDQVTWLGGGKYQGSVTISYGQIFRFFTKADDWGSKQYNYTYFMDGTLSDNLDGTTEGDANLTFTGADGTYDFTVDLYNVSFIIE